MTIMTRLPPFTALRGFEAAARLNSFRLAAKELCLSPSAVSHHVRQLEGFLDQPLFERSPAGVRLTPCGRAYLTEIGPLFQSLAAATDRARRTTKRPKIWLQCSQGFAARWLIPRLPELKQYLGIADICLSTADRIPRRLVDAEITCGYAHPPDGTHELLMTTVRVPVCSPDYLGAHGPIYCPEDLMGHTVLREHQRDDWDRWFALAAPMCAPSVNSLWFDDGYGSTQAAEQGLGILLGHLTLIERELKEGRLIQLFDQTVPESVIYTLRLRQGWQDQPSLVALRHWLLSSTYKDLQAAEILNQSDSASECNMNGS